MLHNNTLRIIRTNKFSNHTYAVNTEDVKIADLDENVVWAIESPPDAIVNQYPSEQVREYNCVQFILSKKALSCLPQSNFGSVCVVSFEFKSEQYFLFVTDNKPYVQNVCGNGEPGETPEQCMVRELKEEIGIDADLAELTPVGYWTFTNTNALINYTAHTTSHVFVMHVEFHRIAHLITGSLSITEPVEFKCENDEIKSVIVIPERWFSSENLPDCLFGKTFGGHHHEAVRRLIGLRPKFDVSYLHDFQIQYRTVPESKHTSECFALLVTPDDSPKRL